MLKFMMVGCLTIVGVGAVGGYMAWQWWEKEGKATVAGAMDQVVTQSIDESQLSASDKKKLKTRVHELMDEFKAGRLSGQDLERAFEEIAKSPVLTAAAVEATWEDIQRFIGDEKAKGEARRTMERFLRGLSEKKIGADAAEQVVSAVSEKDEKGNYHVRKDLDVKQVEALVARMRKAVDDAKIPDEAYKVDYVGEISRIIDKVLAERGKGTPSR